MKAKRDMNAHTHRRKNFEVVHHPKYKRKLLIWWEGDKTKVRVL